MRRLAFLLLLFVPLAAHADLPALPVGLTQDGTATVVEIIDGDTVILDDGVQVRLVGIQAPKLPLGRPNFETWPLAPEAKDSLTGLVLGRRVALAYGGRRQDRHGRLLAHLVREDDGLWVQGALLEAGFARVYGFRDNRAALTDMLMLERRARSGGRGIWSNAYYRVLAPGESGRAVGSFQLVEGRVRSAAVVRGRGYLNFGDNWREDFTISIAPRDRRLFEETGHTIEDYERRLVRVRGWIKSFNGPMIEATHPEQIEILE